MKTHYPERETTLDKVLPGEFQTRKSYDISKMTELVQSIQAQGVINPPVVATENGHYRLLAGERRTRALNALALMADGWGIAEAVALVCQDKAWDNLAAAKIRSRIAVHVRVAPADANLEVISAIENLQRVDLNCIEEAEAYRRMLAVYKTINRVAKETGRSALLIKTRLKALDLESEIQGYMADGRLSKDDRVIEALLSLPTPEVRLQLAHRFVERGTTIKAVELACKKVNDALAQTAIPSVRVPVGQAVIGPAAPPPAPPIEPVKAFCPDCADLVNRLAEELCQGCQNGLSSKCAACPGVLEFIEGLIRRVNHAG